MRHNRVLAELLHLIAGMIVTLAIFRAAIWAYPQGTGSLEPVGWLTMAAVLVMGVPELAKAWRTDSALRKSR